MTVGVCKKHIKLGRIGKICLLGSLNFGMLLKILRLMVTNSSGHSMLSHHFFLKNISQCIKCVCLINNKFGIILILYSDNYNHNLYFITKTKQLIVQNYFCCHTDRCYPLCRMNGSCHTVLKTILFVFFLCVYFYQSCLIWCNAYFELLEAFIHIEVLVYIFIKLNILYTRWSCKYVNLLKPVQAILISKIKSKDNQ